MEIEENEISYKIRGAIFNVYNNLGPGLLESAYEEALRIELEKVGCKVRTQVTLPMVYEGVTIPNAYRIDMLVDDKVIIEIKAATSLPEVFFAQLMTYLKLTGKKLGFLVNFKTTDISKSIYRRVNNL
jgi:GxxExxY protein